MLRPAFDRPLSQNPKVVQTEIGDIVGSWGSPETKRFEMPKNGHTEEQIIAALKQYADCEKTADICRKRPPPDELNPALRPLARWARHHKPPACGHAWLPGALSRSAAAILSSGPMDIAPCAGDAVKIVEIPRLAPISVAGGSGQDPCLPAAILTHGTGHWAMGLFIQSQ